MRYVLWSWEGKWSSSVYKEPWAKWSIYILDQTYLFNRGKDYGGRQREFVMVGSTEAEVEFSLWWRLWKESDKMPPTSLANFELLC